MFEQHNAALIRAMRKFQTVRKVRKIMPRIQDVASLREWEGAPYRSYQTLICDVRISEIKLITIDDSGIVVLSGNVLRDEALQNFAFADGFHNAPEMLAYFMAKYKFPFYGFVTYWGEPGK